MKAVTEIEIDRITVLPEVYPRKGAANWQTIARYAEGMRIGAVFPPIEVVPDQERMILLDGFNRIAAAKQIGRATISAILSRLPRKQWLWRAAEANMTHGRPLTAMDRASIAWHLERDGFSAEAISKLLGAHADTIARWVATRVVANTGEPVKAAVRHVMGTEWQGRALAAQHLIANASVYRTLDELLALLRAGAFDASNQAQREKLTVAYQGIGELLACRASRIPRETRAHSASRAKRETRTSSASHGPRETRSASASRVKCETRTSCASR